MATVGSYWGDVSYERGTPVRERLLRAGLGMRGGHVESK